MPANTISQVYTMSPITPVSPTPSWRNIFKASSKKSSRPQTVVDPRQHLTLETHHDDYIATFDIHAESNAIHPPLTPASSNRYSYNSSDTRSSDSNGGGGGRQNASSFGLAGDTTRSNSPTHINPSVSSQSILSVRSRSQLNPAAVSSSRGKKPGKSQPSHQHRDQAPASSSQQSLKINNGNGNTLSSRGNLMGPLSPRSMSASASRFIRRVASAPSTKYLFAKDARQSPAHGGFKNGFLSPSSERHMPPPPPVPETPTRHRHSPPRYPFDQYNRLADNTNPPPSPKLSSRSRAHTTQFNKSTPILESPPAPPPQRITPRRTYSSNSIKVSQASVYPAHTVTFLLKKNLFIVFKVEVGPNSFQKIKLLGRGDVGKVYLVREKRSDKLFAMKGRF